MFVSINNEKLNTNFLFYYNKKFLGMITGQCGSYFKTGLGDFSGVQPLTPGSSQCRGLGSIPSQGTRSHRPETKSSCMLQ